jgi:hypothetical protein
MLASAPHAHGPLFAFWCLRPVSLSSSIPLSSVQSTYWTTAHLPGGTGGTFHIGSSALIFIGDIDPSVLISILESTLARHEALRTVFRVVSFSVTQSFDGPPPKVRQADLRSDPERYAIAAKFLASEAEARFDLRAGGPPVRVQLTQLEDDVTLISMALHHIVTDFWSANIVFNEICTELVKLGSDSTATANEHNVCSFQDFLVQRESELAVTSEEGKRRLAFWREELDGFEDPAAPISSPQAEDVGGYFFPSAAHFEERVLARAQATGTTFFVVLLDAFARCMRKWTRGEAPSDFLIGFMTANRRDERFRLTVGSFAEPQIVRVRLSENENAETLPTVQAAFKRALANAMPLRDIAVATKRATLHKVLLNVVESPSAKSKPANGMIIATSSPSERALEIESSLTKDAPAPIRESVRINPHLEIRRLSFPMRSFGLDLSVFVSRRALFGQFDKRLVAEADVKERLDMFAAAAQNP